MGLYLCVFENDDELDGLEVGSYEDFEVFREAVTASVENGLKGSVCPVLIDHSDCDGSWDADECQRLLSELGQIDRVFKDFPPIRYNSFWKSEVAKENGIALNSLYDCFFDVDGENLVKRLISLSETSVRTGQPILFQ